MSEETVKVSKKVLQEFVADLQAIQNETQAIQTILKGEKSDEP